MPNNLEAVKDVLTPTEDLSEKILDEREWGVNRKQ